MLSENRFAFKEWAVVCAALERGRQTLIVRKGGIDEGSEGFRVEHREFWLFPTQFHQSPSDVTDDATDLLGEASATEPPAGRIALRSYAVVTDVLHVEREEQLARLAGRHIWSHETVTRRFHYRRPGLFVLVARVYQRAEALILPDSPHFAGCRSWVDLPAAVPAEGLVPVLDEAAFECERAECLRALGPIRAA